MLSSWWEDPPPLKANGSLLSRASANRAISLWISSRLTSTQPTSLPCRGKPSLPPTRCLSFTLTSKFKGILWRRLSLRLNRRPLLTLFIILNSTGNVYFPFVIFLYLLVFLVVCMILASMMILLLRRLLCTICRIYRDSLTCSLIG